MAGGGPCSAWPQEVLLRSHTNRATKLRYSPKKFRTSLCHDVAECGGWRGTETLKECYQMPDPDTMQSVIEGARNLGRESQ